LSERKRTADVLKEVVAGTSGTTSPARASRRFQVPVAAGSQGLPVQFVITTTEPIRI